MNISPQLIENNLKKELSPVSSQSASSIKIPLFLRHYHNTTCETDKLAAFCLLRHKNLCRNRQQAENLHCMSRGECRFSSCRGPGRRSACPSHTPSLKHKTLGRSTPSASHYGGASLPEKKQHRVRKELMDLVTWTHWKRLYCRVWGSGGRAPRLAETTPSWGSAAAAAAAQLQRIWQAERLHVAREDLAATEGERSSEDPVSAAA